MGDQPLFEKARHFLANHLVTMIHGMCVGDWRRLQRQPGNAIATCYRSRARFMTAMSLFNSVAAKREQKIYGEAVAATQVYPPLFILGHWRSGTTLLHNLLACDPQFTAPTLLQTLYPHTFLTFERQLRLLGVFAPRKRLIDDMRFGFEQPQEDEFALCNATLLSPYLTWLFPHSQENFDRFLTLCDVTPQEYTHWCQAFVDFLRKVTLRTNRRLVLKSPAHMARIRVLLELFPEAQFVHIHRNPYAVFQSTRHLYQTMWRTTTLQQSDDLDLDELVLRRYEIVYRHFVAEQPLIPAANYTELSFEELTANPFQMLERLYGELGLAGFNTAHSYFVCHLAGIQGYQKNSFQPLSPPMREKIHQRWQPSFEARGYERQ